MANRIREGHEFDDAFPVDMKLSEKEIKNIVENACKNNQVLVRMIDSQEQHRD